MVSKTDQKKAEAYLWTAEGSRERKKAAVEQEVEGRRWEVEGELERKLSSVETSSPLLLGKNPGEKKCTTGFSVSIDLNRQPNLPISELKTVTRRKEEKDAP